MRGNNVAVAIAYIILQRRSTIMIRAFVSTILLSLLVAPLFVGCDVTDTSSSEPPKEITPTVGTDGLAYELSDNGDFAICTGIGTATLSDIVIASHFEGVIVEQITTSAFSKNEFI